MCRPILVTLGTVVEFPSKVSSTTIESSPEVIQVSVKMVLGIFNYNIQYSTGPIPVAFWELLNCFYKLAHQVL